MKLSPKHERKEDHRRQRHTAWKLQKKSSGQRPTKKKRNLEKNLPKVKLEHTVDVFLMNETPLKTVDTGKRKRKDRS